MENKIISEFMCIDEVVDYSTSWDLLMPVVEKIETLDLSDYGYKWDVNGTICHNHEGITVEIENNSCMIYERLVLDPISIYNEKTIKIDYKCKIDAVYYSVVEFIEVLEKIKESQTNSEIF